MEKTLQEITKILKEHKKEICKKYKVKEIGVFGSFARGEQRKSSDVDILVEFKDTPDVYQLIDLEDYLKELLNRKVDLVRKRAIRPELKGVILKEVVNI
ncbi:MAG: nucleotidyltransferase family protein [Nitrospirae bacterium]|nr:nucleotidyltransferase family protein [Nitrospirota bacterium]